VAVVLYELFLTGRESRRSVRPGLRRISRAEQARLAREWDAVVDHIRYPEHKRKATKLLFRKLLARAVPSAWEYHTMMGVFKRMREKRARAEVEGGRATSRPTERRSRR
jgi:tRNA C32,U32 (ribose-2'-O)-methylase TrmJ